MTILILAVLGLVFGSFSNAVIWRIHEQDTENERKKPRKQYLDKLSITKGRSMCSSCHHELGTLDLIPVASWVLLRGKCRYCHAPIPDSPLVEVTLALLFVLSYLVWPESLNIPLLWVQFVAWLGALVGLTMLAAYDLRWFLLPNRLLWPTALFALVFASCSVIGSSQPLLALGLLTIAVLIGGGVFYIIFQVSKGKWIGGGDVKLGWILGLLVLTPSKSVLFIFLAALLGTLAAIPLMITGKIRQKSLIPFGPFLIAGAIITVWWGDAILDWYMHLTLGQ